MKEKFTLIIETLHANDYGDSENVSSWTSDLINCSFSFFSFAFLSRAASSMLNKWTLKHLKP